MTAMIDNLIQNASENAYISVSVVNTADGMYRVTEVKKLRDLSDEVRRIYEVDCLEKDQDPGERCWFRFKRDVFFTSGTFDAVELRRANATFPHIKAGSILDECVLSVLQKAHERLLEIEKAVAECDEHTIIYLGGSEPATIKVLDCEHKDGSEYSWYVADRDKTEYKPGDVVEIEHLGGYRNEFLPVVTVRTVRESERPACKVAGLANR